MLCLVRSLILRKKKSLHIHTLGTKTKDTLEIFPSEQNVNFRCYKMRRCRITLKVLFSRSSGGDRLVEKAEAGGIIYHG